MANYFNTAMDFISDTFTGVTDSFDAEFMDAIKADEAVKAGVSYGTNTFNSGGITDWVGDAWNWLQQDGLGQQMVIGSVGTVGTYLAQKELQEQKLEQEREFYDYKNPQQASTLGRSYNIAPGQGLISSRYRRTTDD